MKLSVNKTIKIRCTLDSSEAIMFNQGGAHKLKIDPKLLRELSKQCEFENIDEENDNENEGISEVHLESECIIEFQMERSAQGRFNFVIGEANKHREIYDNENKGI
jgi:hypothetical protein